MRWSGHQLRAIQKDRYRSWEAFALAGKHLPYRHKIGNPVYVHSDLAEWHDDKIGAHAQHPGYARRSTAWRQTIEDVKDAGGNPEMPG